MSERSPSNVSGIAVAIFIALFAIGISEQAAAQTTPACPAGTVPVTAANAAAMTAAGLDPATSNIKCWDQNDPGTGQAAGAAKLWLQQHATTAANISCLNSQFAEKLQKFMEADPYGVPTITSGYRSIADQQAIINSGSGATRVTTPCGSYHPWGLAVDFNNNNAQQTAWMRANAKTYGVATIGTWDPNHFQDANGRYGQCGVCDANGGGDNNPASCGIQPAPPASAATGPITDDVPPQSALTGLNIPPGYCVTSSPTITQSSVVPCGSLGASTSTAATSTPSVTSDQSTQQTSLTPDSLQIQTPTIPAPTPPNGAPTTLQPSGAATTPVQIIQMIVAGNETISPAPAQTAIRSFLGQSTSIYGQSEIPDQGQNISISGFTGSLNYGPTFEDAGQSSSPGGSNWLSELQTVLTSFDSFLSRII